jgi:hypothetical protein
MEQHAIDRIRQPLTAEPCGGIESREQGCKQGCFHRFRLTHEVYHLHSGHDRSGQLDYPVAAKTKQGTAAAETQNLLALGEFFGNTTAAQQKIQQQCAGAATD